MFLKQKKKNHKIRSKNVKIKKYSLKNKKASEMQNMHYKLLIFFY